MERSNGMRPQDIAILLKIILKKGQPWKNKDLANELFLSAAEVGHSLNRSALARLIDGEKKHVMTKSLIEFLIHGFPYVFPVRKGAIVKGIPTAYSASILESKLISEEIVVWPFAEGKVKGQSIEPLYKGAAQASKLHKEFYDLLCLLDALRIGRTRDKLAAREILTKQLTSRYG